MITVNRGGITMTIPRNLAHHVQPVTIGHLDDEGSCHVELVTICHLDDGGSYHVQQVTIGHLDD